jgi:hypothetical protein
MYTVNGKTMVGKVDRVHRSLDQARPAVKRDAKPASARPFG